MGEGGGRGKKRDGVGRGEGEVGRKVKEEGWWGEVGKMGRKRGKWGKGGEKGKKKRTVAKSGGKGGEKRWGRERTSGTVGKRKKKRRGRSCQAS